MNLLCPKTNNEQNTTSQTDLLMIDGEEAEHGAVHGAGGHEVTEATDVAGHDVTQRVVHDVFDLHAVIQSRAWTKRTCQD